MSRSRFAFVFLVVAFFCAFAPVSFLFAAGDGIGIKPAQISEGMKPGESRQFSVVISNMSEVDQTYYLDKRDITGVKDGGTPIFADPNVEKTSFELSQWISLDTAQVDVPKGQERTITFTIKAPDNASPGSHFGGIFVSVQPPKLRESGASVGYEVANIISIRIAGDAVEKAEIRQFSTDNYIYGKPQVTFNVKMENTGNTLLRPTGPLEITNMFGKQVASLSFNKDLSGVFPGTTREFTLPWTETGTMFGRYEAIISPVYGEDGFKQTVSSTVTFWILPMNIILPSLIALAVLLLITYVSVRIYVRNKLAYYGAVQSGRRLVRRRKESNSSAFLLVFVVMLTVTALFILILLAFFA
jgi:hypothetical protein